MYSKLWRSAPQKGPLKSTVPVKGQSLCEIERGKFISMNTIPHTTHCPLSTALQFQIQTF